MTTIIEQIQEKVEELIENSTIFLVDLSIKPTNNIKVFLDGDEGITINVISKLNRSLYKQIEESDLFPDGDFSLEVSSAGVDKPLMFFRQYKKNVGRKLEVTLKEEQVITGILKEVSEEMIFLEEEIGKKKEIKKWEIPFEHIDRAIVQVTFK